MSTLTLSLTRVAITARTCLTRRADRGATAVEYGLLVGLIAVAIIVVVGALGTQLSGLFGSVSSSLP